MNSKYTFKIHNILEYIIPVIAIISLIISCIIVSRKKFFWNDELYSYYFFYKPSFMSMMVAFNDKINNTPPLYFILGWFWTRVFGASELSLRLFSSLGICAASVTVWIVLRRTYNVWVVAVGSLAVFCTSDIILNQNAEARMYGLFLAIAALILLLFDSINRNSKITYAILAINGLAHAALVQTHLFGFFYSGATLFSFIIRDIYFNVFRSKIYLSIVFSWLSIILYLPAFLIQADAGNPRTWVPTPTFQNLIDFITLSSSSFLKLFVLFLLVLVSGWQFIWTTQDIRDAYKDKQKSQNVNAEISLLIFAYSFLTVPVFVWIISRTLKPIFWDRYMIPTALSWSILLAYVSSRILFPPIINNEINRRLKSFKFLVFTQQSIILLILIFILFLQPILYAKTYRGRYIPGLNDNKYGYQELPIVVQASAQFLERFYYSPNRNKYFFILDWQAAVDNASGQFGPQEYKHLDAFKRNYPELFQNNILQSKDFLKRHDRFLVLDYLDYKKKCPLKAKGTQWDNIHCPQWVEMRLLNNPNYKVRELGEIYGETMLLVEPQQ
jgi:uncharacterized membrane protein